MQGIGERLRQARMRRDIDIADVEAATKIRAKYLRAMENEEFGLLPGPTFVTTFLRTYAEHLGLDPHLLVQEYRTLHDPSAADEAFHPYTPPQQRYAAGAGGPRRPRLRIVAAVAVVALLGLFFVLGRTGDDPRRPPAGGQAAQTGSGEAARPRAEREARARRGRPAGARRVTLRVAPTERTYVCVDNGAGRVLFEGTLEEPRRFRGRRLRLNLGRRTARIVVNGRAVAIPPGSEPIGFDFRPRRRPRQLAEGARPCA